MTDTITHITTSGGLITQAFIDNIREPATRQPGTEPATFHIHGRGPQSPADTSTPLSTRLEDDIAAAWELLKERWDAVHDEIHDLSVSDVRARWLMPLFQVLDFDPQYRRGDTVIDDDLRFDLSHRGWDPENFGFRNSDFGLRPPVIHMVAPSQDLDERAGSGRSMKDKSPHDMLQAYLNLSPDDRWAILTNGIVLRLLRDYHHTFTKGYVEFDLESIFETRNYGDFRALYRMCHASRFVPPQTSEVSETSEVLTPLEQFYKTALATGIKAGEDLREQVRQAIETLGNGFLDGPLIRRLQNDPDACQGYYGEILRIIYRVLFLLFAEQRGLLPRAGAELEDLYRNHYSITALRARAEGDIPRHDDHTDLWRGLQATFQPVRDGADPLGVFGYDGMLFEDPPASLLHGADESRSALVGARQAGDQVSVNLGTDFPLASPLRDRSIPNSALLRAIRALTLIEREGVLQRISYADLGVEELGSIYESLLDFTPRVTTAPENVDGREVPANTFFLDPRGLERKSTGSYYTHPSLVNELIRSALLPVMRDRLASAGLPVVAETDPATDGPAAEVSTGLLTDYAGLTPQQRQTGEEAILSIRVCDPAAGSGHFLVKANNVLGAEPARIRTGDDYPSESAVQAAKRDVLAECIYAVDLNPMAVELCKVSLWINASVADRPLSFLDHHIKCGNSLIGATPALLEDGVPYDAFALGRPGDDRELAKAIRRGRDHRQRGHSVV